LKTIKYIMMISFPILISFVLSCSPTPTQIKKIILDNPDIIADTFQKHPLKLMEAINKDFETSSDETKDGRPLPLNSTQDQVFR